LADDRLPNADVIADIFDPAARDLADVGEPAFVLVLIEVDEDPEIGDFVDFTDDEVARLGPATVFHLVCKFLQSGRNYRASTVSTIS
jgi:hypothetical protein